MRVVSLLPSATEMVHFAGAGDSLVGVTHECDYPPEVSTLPKLTRSKVDPAATGAEIDAAVGALVSDGESVYALDAGLLARLAPDLILTQGLCEVCAVSSELVAEAAAALGSEPEVLSLNPTSLNDVLGDAVTVGEALGREDRTRAEVERLEARLRLVEERVAEESRPTVGCLEWLEPPFSAGHWVPEMVALAGGEEAFAGPGERSARLRWEAVLEADPEVLVLMPCGLGVERTLAEARRVLPDLPGWSDLRAVRGGRVWAVDANAYFSRPAPRLVRGAEILGRILHPDAFPDPPAGDEAVPLDATAAPGPGDRSMARPSRPV